MISSAVVIPEQPPAEEPGSPSLKRRSRSPRSPGANKRPRLDTDNINGSANSASANSASPPAAASAISPPRRKPSLLTSAEEKKRGQRLFGGLLGTLSQTTSKPAHKKREEIEKRQQERIQRDTAEREEIKRLKKEELDRIRRGEQKSWDAQSTRLRHRYIRRMANFLKTRTEPVLYYKPWELRPEEEETIKRQKDEAEALSRTELEKGRKDDQAQIRHNGTDTRLGNSSSHHPDGEVPVKDGEKAEESIAGTEKPEEPDIDRIAPNGDDESKDGSAQIVTSESFEATEAPADDKSKEDDHGGEELVEGHEDDVIY